MANQIFLAEPFGADDDIAHEFKPCRRNCDWSCGNGGHQTREKRRRRQGCQRSRSLKLALATEEALAEAIERANDGVLIPQVFNFGRYVCLCVFAIRAETALQLK